MSSHKWNQRPSALRAILPLLVVAVMGLACAPLPAAPAPTPVSLTVSEVTAAPAKAELDLANLSPGIPDPPEPVVVTFASWVGGGAAWQNLAKQFHELHPNITIEFHDVPFEEIRTKLLAQVAAGNPPDVAYMDASTTSEFASRNALIALDDFIAMSKAVDPDDYVEAFLQTAIYEGKIYGLPIDGESTGLFYRTDLFAEAGIEKAPETWEEFEEAAARFLSPQPADHPGCL